MGWTVDRGLVGDEGEHWAQKFGKSDWMFRRIILNVVFFTASAIAAVAPLTSAFASGASPSGKDIRFPIEIAEGRQVRATVRIPDDYVAGERLPVLLVFGGFESAGQVLDLIHDHAGVALATFDYPFSGDREFRFSESFLTLPEAKALYSETVRGIANLVRALRLRPDIDSHRIVLLGASFGTPFALGAAADDPGIAGLVIVHGFGRVPQTMEKAILRSWLPKYGWVARPLSWLVARLGWAYLRWPEPERLARSLHPEQKILMISAEHDSFVPRSASDSLWEAIRQSSADATRKLEPTDHLMPGSDALIAQIVGEIRQWMKNHQLLAG